MIRAFCNPWHLTTSPAFHDQLVVPLRGLLDLTLAAWDSEAQQSVREPAQAGPLVFCQLLPPAELLDSVGARLVWIPNWDDLHQWTQTDWDRLPSRLRVVAYSDAVGDCAEKAGLPTLRVRYHKDPCEHVPVAWEGGPVMFYWNRTGLFGPNLLPRLCSALGIRKLLYRARTDPGVAERLRYELPQRLGRTEVRTIPDWMPREEFAAAITEANVVLAPRVREGVGMVMLEAMARGCAVIGLDAPTMNECIRHGQNGLLLPARRNAGVSSLVRRTVNRARRLAGRPPLRFREGLARRLDWDELASHDLKPLGDQARADQEAGYAAWRAQVAGLARFLSEWP